MSSRKLTDFCVTKFLCTKLFFYFGWLQTLCSEKKKLNIFSLKYKYQSIIFCIGKENILSLHYYLDVYWLKSETIMKAQT